MSTEVNRRKKWWTLSRQRSYTGFLFVLPFIIGFILFFLAPFLQSIQISMSTLRIVPGGYALEYVSFANFRQAFLVHTSFVRIFTETMVQTLVNIPAIIFFSFFAALLLNQKFRGRLLTRTIFFLPVILSSGYILATESTDFMQQMLQTVTMESADESLFGAQMIRNFMMEMRLPRGALDYIIEIVDGIPYIIRASGIQILIFLAGLQSVPSSVYEASKVEGASAWQAFWLITIPIVSPIFLANVIYTIIDSLLSPVNPLVELINDAAFSGGGGFGLGAAMGVTYFGAIAVLLALTVLILSRFVFYQE